MKWDRVHKMFSNVAARIGDAPAVEYGDRRMRYRELEERSNNLANFLLASGASKGSIVAVLAEDRIEVVMAIIAALKAGCVFVPLDPNLPERRMASMVDEVPPGWFIVESKLIDRIPLTSGAKVICLDSTDAPDGKRSDLTYLREYAGYCNAERPDVSSRPDDMCYVYFTSGSTGRPKGIAGRLKAIDHFVKWEIETFGIGEGTRVSQLTSPSFDAYLRDIFVPLCSGGTVCGPKQARTSLDVKSLIEWIDLQKINLIHCVPSLLRSMLGFGLEPNYFSALKHVLLAGEPVLPSDVKKWTEIFGDRIQLVNMYGPSETTMTKLYYLIKPHDSNCRSIPIGKPMPGAKAMVVGSDGKTCPPGTVGEIYIRTPFRSLGYYKRPELTNKAFIPNPFTGDPDDLIYKTGDLGRVLEDGNLEFLGRKDQQVKIRGIRVELKEIEDLLLGHESVKDVVVIDRDDALGNKYLCAYVECAKETDASIFKDFLATRLPDYLVPSMFVMMLSLPRTITGKIDRRALPSIDQERDAAGRAYLAPRTQIEEVIAAIWSQVLNLRKIGIEENFFDIGGHSLLATQVVSRMHNLFGIELPLQTLFENTTIAQLGKQVEALIKKGPKLDAPPLAPAPREGALPLSYAQQRLWFIDQLQPGSAFYNLPFGLRLSGMIEMRALRMSLDEIVRRHEGLRTCFHLRDGHPVQEIVAPCVMPLPVIDLSELGAENADREALRLAQIEAACPFDLRRAPLLRLKLLRLEEGEHVLLATLHHIVADGWSIGVLARELTLLYNSYAAGKPSPLPELPIQYVDFAIWQRQWLQGGALEQQLNYWREQLAELEPLDLPTDHARPPSPSFRGGETLFTLDSELAAALRSLSRQEGVTLFMTLLAVWQALLGRYAGQTDVAVGVPIANRTRLEIEGLIGFFVNTLVLRANLAGRPSFRKLLGQVRQTVLEAYVHQDLPFERIVEELEPERDLNRSPLFQVVMALQNAPGEEPALSGLQLKGLRARTETSRFDLTLNLVEGGDGTLKCALEYAKDLFDDETIRRLANHWKQILASAVRTPERPVGELEFLSDRERRQFLVEWNKTEPCRIDRWEWLEWFGQIAEARPAAIAVASNDDQLSYAGLRRRSNQLAEYLRRLGVERETRVAICLDRGVNMLVGLLGVLKAGGTYVPLDRNHPSARLAEVLADSQSAVLLTESALLNDFHPPEMKVICLDTDSDLISSMDFTTNVTAFSPGNLAYIIYTSGSTGRSKGVGVTHEALANCLFAMRERLLLGPEDTLLAVTTLSFDIAALELYLPLIVGGRVVIAGRAVTSDGEQLVEWIGRAGTTVLFSTPSAWRLMLEAGWEGREGLTMLCGGEALSPDLADRLRLCGASLWNMYGPTETTVLSLAHRMTDHEENPSIGKPIANTQIYVLDLEQEPVPVGVAGELYLGGRGLARGYLNRPGQTAERFVPHPFSDGVGERLYRTGDLVRWRTDGRLEFLRRIDHQVKLRGYRIELGEIEAVLNGCEGVRQSVVTLREDVAGQARLVAYVVTEAGCDDLEIRNQLQQRLPSYMRPSAILRLERLPLTPNGKLDRKALPVPGAHLTPLTADSERPQTPMEELLAGIWAQVLKVERVGRHDHFFDIGGHSLLAMQVVSRLRSALQVEAPVRMLFEEPELWVLARSLEQAQRSRFATVAPPLRRVERHHSLPLSFAQQRLWFLHQLEPEDTAYHMPERLWMTGPLNMRALRKSFDHLVRRHEILRTGFPSVNGQPIQQVDPPLAMSLPMVDLQALAQRESVARQVAYDEMSRPFDLERGPLWRVLLLKLDEHEHVLLFTMHHMISDGWSMGILVREFTELYNSYHSGRTPLLPELPIQYVDYAVWQRACLQGEMLEEQLAYWRRHLAASSASGAELFPASNSQSHQRGRAARESSILSPAFLQELEHLARQHNVTLFMVVLAAWKLLLSRYTGVTDIIIGTPVANRTRQEIEPLIGFFANTLALRTDLSGNPRVSELLSRIRQITLDAFAHQDLPFDKLVEELAPERVVGRNPLFQVAYVLQNTPQEPLHLDDLELHSTHKAIGNTLPFDLTLQISVGPQGGQMLVDYDAGLFDADFIRRMRTHLERLLQGMVDDPTQRATAIPLMTAAEREQLIEDCRLPANRFSELDHSASSGWPLMVRSAAGFGERRSLPVYLLDDELEPAPFGIVGEVYIGGEDVARGYLSSPARTATQFIPDPFSLTAGARLVKTGERGRWTEDGRLQVIAGSARCVILNGCVMDLDELESALMRHTAVSDCAISLRQAVSGEECLVAYVVSLAPWLPESLHSYLAPFLPSTLPVVFLPISNVPLTVKGRVDEQRLHRVPVIDADAIKQWEQFWQEVEGVDQVAVIVRDRPIGPPRLQIPAMLPAPVIAPSSLTCSISNESSESADGSSTHNGQQTPSLSVGEPLVWRPDDPVVLTEALRRAASLRPSRGITHVAPDRSEHTESYAELLNRAERLLAGLRSLGLRPGDKVILQLERSEEFVAGFWACTLGGFVPAPIGIAPTYREQNAVLNKLIHAWHLLERPWILASAGLATQIGDASVLVEVGAWNVADYDELLSSKPDADWHRPNPDDLAILLLTSGSTGKPKAVMLSHHNILYRSAATAERHGFHDGTVCLNWMPLDHVGGIVFCHLRNVYLGGPQVLAATEAVTQDPLLWLDLCSQYKVSFTWAPNFAFDLVNERLAAGCERQWDLSELQYLINGGEAVSPRTASRFLTLLAPFGLPPTAMKPTWGMSETSSGVAYSDGFRVETKETAELQADVQVDVGPPLPGVSLRIVDSDNRIVPEGVIGRLQISGPTVTAGYYHDPDQTRSAFTDDGWFNTGDLGILSGGRLTVTGREKDQIIIHGVNFTSQEIESVVDEIPGVVRGFTAACAVRRSGNSSDQLALFFHPASNGPSELQMIAAQIRRRLATEVGIHSDLLIPVEPDEIPKTSTGKIQRALLRERFEADQFRGRSLNERPKELPAWFFRTIWRRRELSRRVTSDRRNCTLIFLDGLGLGEAMREQLSRRKGVCITVEAANAFTRVGPTAYRLDPGDSNHYRRLLDSLLADDLSFKQILHLWQYTEYKGEVQSIELLEQAQALGALSVILLTQALADRADYSLSPALYIVGTQMQSLDRAEPLAYEKATTLGVVKTLVQEPGPWSRVRHIDLEYRSMADQVALLSGELESDDPEIEIAYRGGVRWAPRLQRVDSLPAAAGALPFRAGGHYLLAGGLGGIGTQLARLLLTDYQAKLLLIGRTELSKNRDKQTIVEELRNLGGEVQYEALDLGDIERLRAVAAKAESAWGAPFDGVIHLADTLNETPVQEESKEGLARGLQAKLIGTWALRQIIAPGRLFLAFSSVNSFFGGLSVGVYAAANRALESFCQHQQQAGNLDTYCFSWSQWADIGLSRNYHYREISQYAGYSQITAEQGIASLLVALRSKHRHMLIGLDGVNRRIRQWMESGECHWQELEACYTVLDNQSPIISLPVMRDRFLTPVRCATRRLAQMPVTPDGKIDDDQLRRGDDHFLSSAAKISPRTETERMIAAIWESVLGLTESDVTANFFELGGHSLLATQVVSRLQEQCGVQLPVRALFESPTIARLAERLERSFDDQPNNLRFGSDHTIQRRTQTGAELLIEKLDQMSEEEIDQLLNELPEGNLVQ